MGSDKSSYRGPRIGLCLPYEGTATAQDIVDVAHAAETAGLDSVWVGDHIAFPVEFTSQNPTMADGKYPYPTDNPRLEALTTLAFVAGATSTVKLMLNACVLPQRNPVIVGKAVATLDYLSMASRGVRRPRCRLLSATAGAGGWHRDSAHAVGARPALF